MALAGLADASAKTGTISNPTGLKVTYDARIASDSRNLWLATVTSGAWGAYYVQVARYGNGDWITMPGRPLTSQGTVPNDGVPIQLALLRAAGSKRSRPCIGDSPEGQGRVRCLTGRRWRAVASSPEFAGMSLEGLRSQGKAAIGLFKSQDGATTSIRIGKISGGIITPLGDLLVLPGEVEADLGDTTSEANSQAIDVGLEASSAGVEGQRSVATLNHETWTTSESFRPSRNAWHQISGPVRTRSATYVPVVGDPLGKYAPINLLPFSVFRNDGSSWNRVGGRKVSRVRGANVGGVFPVGRRVWAVWTTLAVTNHGIEPMAFAARVSKSGRGYDQRITIRKGDVIDYIHPQAVQFKGQAVFLYMRYSQRSMVPALRFGR